MKEITTYGDQYGKWYEAIERNKKIDSILD